MTHYKIHNLDKILCLLGLILSISLIFIIFKLNKPITYLIPGFLSLISCIIWLFIRKNSNLTLNNINSKNISLLLSLSFYITLTLSILTFYLRPNLYERPLLYFLLISLMSCIIILEILFNYKNKSTKFILVQIIIVGLNLIWTQQAIFPSVVGIDPAWHMNFISYLLDTNHLLRGTNYSNIPLNDIEIAITTLLTNYSYKVAVMLSISFIQITCIIIFMFLIGKKIFNENIGLITALLLSFSNTIIQFGWWAVPTSTASIFIPMIIYLLLKNKSKAITVLMLILMLALILTHTVTSMWLAVLLVSGWIISIIYNHFKRIPENYLTFSILSIFVITMFSWWIYASGTFDSLVKIVLWGFNVDYFHKGVILTNYSQGVSLLEQIYNNMGLFVFSALSLIGFLYAISKKNLNAILIAFFGLITLGIGFFSLVSGKEFLNVRWLYFSQILISLLVAVSIIVIYNFINNKKLKYIFIVVSVGSLSFLMITSLTANANNVGFSPDLSTRSAFTSSEMLSAQFFSTNAVNGISSDFDFATNPSSSVFINYYNYNESHIKGLDMDLYTGSFKRDGTVKIIRYYLVEHPFRLEAGLYKLKYDPNVRLSDSGFNRIYDSQLVTAYL